MPPNPLPFCLREAYGITDCDNGIRCKKNNYLPFPEDLGEDVVYVEIGQYAPPPLTFP